MNKSSRKRRFNFPNKDEDGPKPKFNPFTAEARAEEEKLTEILFGGASSILKSLEEAEKEAGVTGTEDSGVGETDDSDDNSKLRKQIKERRTPAWHDEGDDGIEVGRALDIQGRHLPQGGINARGNRYTDLLRRKFETLHGETPQWARLDQKKDTESDEDDDDEDILKQCGFIRKPTRNEENLKSLPAGVIDLRKVKDLNAASSYNEGPYINAVEFHRGSSAALVAGYNGVCTLYAVDGKQNTKLHSIAFEKFHILCARFGLNEALLGSRCNFIYGYDLGTAKAVRYGLPFGVTNCKYFEISPINSDSRIIAIAGKWGEVHLLDGHSKELISTLKQESDVTALTFNAKGNLLYGHGTNGEVTIWDVNSRRIRHKFVDDGCLEGSAIAVSGDYLATGSAQGVVNLYDLDEVLRKNRPTPRKSVLNLTTGVTQLCFNNSGSNGLSSEVLAFSSPDIQNSVKLLHCASGTVFSNFPGAVGAGGAKLGYVNAVKFSPNGGFLAIGNRKSTVALYRFKHFKNY